MSTTMVLAVVPVADFDAAVSWYERFFGRQADARPMPGLADWHLTGSAWVQVFRDPGRAGATLLNFAVDDMDTHRAELAERGLTSGEITTTSKNARLSAITDPEGNTITLIENPSV